MRVSEVSQHGSVSDLCVVNDSDRTVLLLDGEDLRGAKQNRVLNLTILVPAGKTVIVLVSCVEQGRFRRGEAAAGPGRFSGWKIVTRFEPPHGGLPVGLPG